MGQLVKKTGIAWIRDGEARIEDCALPVAKTNNLCYMPCFTQTNPPWSQPLEKYKDAQGNWDFSDVVEWHRKYAEKYGKDIDCYDLKNEPHGLWGGVLGGSWYGGNWQTVFVKYGRQVTQAIKAADPGAKVIWEDVTSLLWYRQFFDLGAADTIDSISPHPYNMKSNPFPEEQGMAEQMSDFKNFGKEHNLSWEVISGEVGFPSYRLPDPPPPSQFYPAYTELQQAQFLVRMMVGQLSRGVKRIFYYDFRNDGVDPYNPECNFGLVTYDLSPKPAVVAYANLIYHLKNCRWLGRYTIGGGGYAYAYIPEHSSKPALIAWMKESAKTEPVPVPSDVKELTITDIFGNSVIGRVENHLLQLNLSGTPVYVEGFDEADIKPLVFSLP
jgi:hypothetical protein